MRGPRRVYLVVLFWISLLVCLTSYLGAGYRAAAAQDALSADTVAPEAVHEVTAHFALRSHPWLSLHHFLYQWACTEDADRRCARRMTVSEKKMLAALPEPDRILWLQAVELYRAVQDRSLLFDDALIQVKSLISEPADSIPANLSDVPLGLGKALEAAMPVYRKHWWDQHRERARQWMRTTAATLRSVEASSVAQLEHVYGGTWPEEPVQVDVTPYANWAGAYTTVRPTHVIIMADGNGGDARDVEVLLHESAHGDFFTQPLKSTLRTAFRAHQAEPPDRLWHSVIFFVSGEVARRTVADRPSEFKPYWAGIDAFVEGERRNEFDALRSTLGALFEGMIERDAAFDALASRLSATSSAGTDAPE
ncbi:hypothetical protein [Longibacter sp.]|uniref:hypothetical protein n=1 Tax=Longibacter sp. TaxID=2045415 RepID=UPI003EBDCABF